MSEQRIELKGAVEKWPGIADVTISVPISEVIEELRKTPDALLAAHELYLLEQDRKNPFCVCEEPILGEMPVCYYCHKPLKPQLKELSQEEIEQGLGVASGLIPPKPDISFRPVILCRLCGKIKTFLRKNETGTADEICHCPPTTQQDIRMYLEVLEAMEVVDTYIKGVLNE